MNKILTSILNFIYLSPIRSWSRHLGLNRLILNAHILSPKNIDQYAEYERDRPTSLDVGSGECVATMLVADAAEYGRCLSFRQDQHIIQAILDRVSPGDSCWDIGANIGVYTVILARTLGVEGSVIAFEPESRAFQRLEENIAVNHLSNVSSFRIALGRDRQQMKLRTSGHASSGTHSLVLPEAKMSKSEDDHFEVVEVVPGDQLRQQKQLQIPSIIKVDVEGAEEEVLVGLQETLCHPACRTVVCEVHFTILESAGKRNAPKQIIQFLRGCGFSNTVWLDQSHLAAYK